MTDNNLLPINDIIKKIERRKMTCDWEDVASLQTKIAYYQNKLANGVKFEPAF